MPKHLNDAWLARLLLGYHYRKPLAYLTELDPYVFYTSTADQKGKYGGSVEKFVRYEHFITESGLTNEHKTFSISKSETNAITHNRYAHNSDSRC